jgi:hypothetical protein
LRDVFLDERSAEPRRIHVAEQTQRFCALVLALDTRQHSVGFQIAHRGDRHTRHRQRAGEAATKVHAGQDVVVARIDITNGPAKPAFGADFVGLTGVPNMHGAEVRAVRVGIADALNDGHFPLVPQGLDGLHSRVEPNALDDGQVLLRVDPHHRPVLQVEWVGVGDDRIQRVIAPDNWSTTSTLSLVFVAMICSS